MTEYNEKGKYGNLTAEFKPQMILDAVKELFEQPGMKSSNSLLIINLNVHHARFLPFARYKEFIGNLTYLLKNREKLFGSKARVVWRTTTALTYTMKMDRLRASKYLTSDVSKNIVLIPADLTVRKRPGTSCQIEIHFAVFNPLYLLFCFINLIETW